MTVFADPVRCGCCGDSGVDVDELDQPVPCRMCGYRAEERMQRALRQAGYVSFPQHESVVVYRLVSRGGFTVLDRDEPWLFPSLAVAVRELCRFGAGQQELASSAENAAASAPAPDPVAAPSSLGEVASAGPSTGLRGGG